MSRRVTIREFGARIGLWTDETFDRNQKAVVRGFTGVAKAIRTVAVQMAIFEVAARTMRARVGDRMLHANLRRLHSGIGLVHTLVSTATDAYDRFRMGLGLINDQTVEHARYLDRQAQALRLTTDEFQQLTFAFSEYGLTEADAVSALERFARNAENALDKTTGATSEARQEFERLGVSVERLKGESSLRILEEIAHAYQNAEDPQAAKNAIYRLLGEDASTFFGESLARKLIPALDGGAQGITELRRIARDSQLTIDPQLIQQGKELALQFGILNQQVEVFWNEVGLRLAPAVQVLVELWQDLIIANSDWLELRLDQAAEAITAGVEALDYAIRRVDWQFVTAIFLGSLAFLQLTASMIGAAAATTLWVGTALALNAMMNALFGFSIPGLLIALGGYIIEATAAIIVTLGLDAALAPLVAVLGLVAAAMAGVVAMLALWAIGGLAVILFVDDLLAYLAGGDSLIGRFIASLENGTGVFGAFGKAAYQAGRIIWHSFGLVADVMAEVWEIVSEAFGIDFHDVMRFAAQVLGEMAKIAVFFLMAFASALEFVADTLEAVRLGVRNFKEALQDLMDVYSAFGQLDVFGPQTWGPFVGEIAEIVNRPGADAQNYTDNRQLYIEQHITSGDPGETQDATRRGAREFVEGTQQ